MDKIMGFKFKLRNKELHNKIWSCSFGYDDIDNVVIDLAELFDIENSLPLSNCNLEEDAKRKLESITELEDVRIINSDQGKWNNELEESDFMFYTFDQSPDGIMKYFSLQHKNQIMEVVRYEEDLEDGSVKENYEYWLNGIIMVYGKE